MRIALRTAAIFALAASLFGQTPVPVSTTNEATLPPATAAAHTALVPQKAAPAAAEIAPGTPIVILQGICAAAPAAKGAAAKAKPKSCKTVITKAEMEAMLDILVPGAAPEMRHQFALNYIRMLAASSIAQEKRLSNDPAVAKELEVRTQFTRMQVMASSLYKRVEKLGDDVSESELQSYYSEHAASFVQGDVERLLFPRMSSAGSPVDPALLKAKVEEIKVRADKGEEFEALQKDIVKALSAIASLPPTKMPMIRKVALTPLEAKVFDLKPGELTEPLESASGFEILKLVTLKPIPLDAVRAELKMALTNGHLQLIMKDATQGVTANFNLAYLNLPSAPELFLSPSLRPPAGSKPGMNAGMAGRPGAGPNQRPSGAPASPQAPAVEPEKQ